LRRTLSGGANVAPAIGLSDRKPSAHPRRFTRLCAGSAFGIALLAEAGWLFHARFLAGQLGGCIPMSPTTALALLLLSGGVFCHERWSEHGRSRRLALVLACVPALLGLLVLAQFFAGFDSGLEWALSRTNEVLGRVRIGRMSPWSAGTFLLESAALMLVLQASRRRFATSVAALLALLATAGSLVVSVGYAYGVPLLSGGTTIPMSLPPPCLRAAGRGRDQPGGARAADAGRMERRFDARDADTRVPANMLFFILVEDWVQTRTAASLNPALLHSLTALACCALIVAISFWTARRTGDAIDRAEQALRESESQYRELFESSSDAIFLIDTATDRIVEANDMATMLYGYNHDELLAKKGTDLSAEPEDTRQHIQAARRAPGEVSESRYAFIARKTEPSFPSKSLPGLLSAGKRCSCSSRPATSPSASGRRKPCGIARCDSAPLWMRRRSPLRWSMFREATSISGVVAPSRFSGIRRPPGRSGSKSHTRTPITGAR